MDTALPLDFIMPPNNDFFTELSVIVDLEEIDSKKFSIKFVDQFIGLNLSSICRFVGNPDRKVQNKLFELSKLIDGKFKDNPKASSLVLKIKGIAQGLYSEPEKLEDNEQIKRNFIGHVLSDNGCYNLSLLDILSANTEMKSIAEQMKLEEIEKRDIPLSYFGCKNAKEAIDYIIKNKLKNANLSEYSDLSANDLDRLTKECLDLTKISIGSPTIPEAKIVECLKKLTNLESLKLKDCFQVTNNFIRFLETLVNLKELSIDKCSGVTELFCFGKLVNLENLSLSFSFEAELPDEIFDNCTKLKKLKLENCTPDLGECFKNLVNLEDLELIFCDISDVYLEKMVSLQSLSFKLCNQITGECFKNFENLKKLDLNFCKKIVGERLGHLVNLENLDIAFCDHIPEQILEDCKQKLEYLKSYRNQKLFNGSFLPPSLLSELVSELD